MKYDKYLPIGTVVLLKGGEQKVMITGFIFKTPDDNKTYDYTGCMYPEGYLSSDSLMLFNHEDIARIYYIGYSDEEDKEFKKKISEIQL